MQNQHPRHSGILITLAGLGFLDAFFLSYEHFKGLIPPCTVRFSCDVVTTSNYSYIFNIPVAYLGLLYYLVLFIGAFMFYENKESNVELKLLALLSGFGFLSSVYFSYVQGFVLNAWCLYCIFSAITSTLFFVSTLHILRHRRRLLLV